MSTISSSFLVLSYFLPFKNFTIQQISLLQLHNFCSSCNWIWIRLSNRTETRLKKRRQRGQKEIKKGYIYIYTDEKEGLTKKKKRRPQWHDFQENRSRRHNTNHNHGIQTKILLARIPTQHLDVHKSGSFRMLSWYICMVHDSPNTTYSWNTMVSSFILPLQITS